MNTENNQNVSKPETILEAIGITLVLTLILTGIVLFCTIVFG